MNRNKFQITRSFIKHTFYMLCLTDVYLKLTSNNISVNSRSNELFYVEIYVYAHHSLFALGLISWDQ